MSYARPASRDALAALFALDERLGGIVRAARAPLVGQMRLTWWHDALTALDGSPPPAEPVLEALARDALPRGVRGEALAGMIDGWEALLDEGALDEAALRLFARERGGHLFTAAARALGADDPVEVAGEGWALADLAAHWTDPAGVALSERMARERLKRAPRRWSRAARPLGALTLLARADLSGSRPGDPARVFGLLRLRFTGR